PYPLLRQTPAPPQPLAKRRSTLHPSTMQMVIEALQAKDSKKGASATAIKKFILAKYPTVDPIRLKYWLKVALNKGLSRGDLVRPPNSTATGAAGSFKAPGKGCSGPSMALAAESAGGDSDDNPAGARAKQPRKTPVGKSKGKAPKGAQPEAPKVKGGEGKVRKPRVQPGAGEGEASLRKAVPPPAGRKAP
uniref:H15 domain-containing protein n=1 Tax=Strigops habroptila TaxID=2489341 RepID=A0A672V7R5_STRHB